MKSPIGGASRRWTHDDGLDRRVDGIVARTVARTKTGGSEGLEKRAKVRIGEVRLRHGVDDSPIR
jgi:hypothetical protein